MWLIRKTAGGRQDCSGAFTRLTSATSGEEYIVGAYEARQLPVCAPYGVYARPVQGQEAVVLSAQGGAQLCLGSVTEGWPEGCIPGKFCCARQGARVSSCAATAKSCSTARSGRRRSGVGHFAASWGP